MSSADRLVLLSDWLLNITVVWRRHGLGRLFASGLSLGLEHGSREPSFVDHVLEPVLQATERLLAGLSEAGRLSPVEPRAAALSLLGPIVVALLHQDNLGGDRCRPLDIEAYARADARIVLDALGRPP